jgi:hypothetical protein
VIGAACLYHFDDNLWRGKRQQKRASTMMLSLASFVLLRVSEADKFFVHACQMIKRSALRGSTSRQEGLIHGIS